MHNKYGKLNERVQELERAMVKMITHQAKGGERVITLELPNGESVTAPVGIWFLAFTTFMETSERTKLLEYVQRMQKEHIAKHPIWNASAGAPGLDLSQFGMSGQGVVTHTDFSVDDKGKKHYTMHCEKGVIAGDFGH